MQAQVRMQDVNPGAMSAEAAARAIALLAGCAILAFGISVEVAPNVIVVPGRASCAPSPR